MNKIAYYLRLVLPVALTIFILGAKPSKVCGQETEDGHAYIYCFSDSEKDGKAKAIAKIICSKDDGLLTITTEDDGEIKLIVKSVKDDGESTSDIYIIKSKPKDKKKKKKRYNLFYTLIH